MIQVTVSIESYMYTLKAIELNIKNQYSPRSLNSLNCIDRIDFSVFLNSKHHR